MSYIYLLQDGKDKGTNVYKIGRTSQNGGDARKLMRLQAYSTGTVIYNLWKVNDDLLETIEYKIKKQFKRSYELVRGSEWFDGNVKQMKQDIDNIIESTTTCVDISDSEIQEDANLDKSSDTNTQVDNSMPKPKRFSCDRCGKRYAKNSTLKHHVPVCKGVSNPLECHLCHKIFTYRGNKSRHIRVCKGLPAIDQDIEQIPDHKQGHQQEVDVMLEKLKDNGPMQKDEKIAVLIGLAKLLLEEASSQ